MNIKQKAKNFFKIFFSAHEIFMKRPGDFALGVSIIGLVIGTILGLMESVFPETSNGLLLFFESILYLSVFGAFFSYPMMTHIIDSVKYRNGMDWKYEFKSFLSSPMPKIYKAVSGGFIFGLVMSIGFMTIFSVSNFIFFRDVAPARDLSDFTPQVKDGFDLFEFLMISVSIVPLNWLINAISVKTFFPSKEVEMVYIRTTASLILILICSYTILSWILSYFSPDLEVVKSILGLGFLVYFISLLAINDHSIRANEKGNGPFIE